MQRRLVTNVFGQHFVLARGPHWLSGAIPPRPSYIDDEWSAGMFIRSLDMEPNQWRRWVDLDNVGPRYDERVYISAAIKELAQGRFNVYPVPQEEFLRTIPKVCTFQNNRDPDDQLYEYAIIPSPVALIRSFSEPVPLIIARRLLQAWVLAVTQEHLKKMFTLLQLHYGKADTLAQLQAMILAELNSGSICLVRSRRSVAQAREKQPELVPYVHKPVPLSPPASFIERNAAISSEVRAVKKVWKSRLWSMRSEILKNW